MPEAHRWRGTAAHLRDRARTALAESVRAQLLALADYYEDLAEDFERLTALPVAAPLP